MTGPRRVRFAPSPTGSLHLGNARTALFNWLVARRAGGRLVLRIEDTDRERTLAGSEDGILEDLRWLGLDWDEGPDRGGDFGPYRQSERAASYRAAAARLLDEDRAYRCFCDEENLAREREARTRAGRAPHYSRRCRALSLDESRRRAADEPFVIRFDAALGAPRVEFADLLHGRVSFAREELGDAVLVRRNCAPTYNFAVVVDDAAMEIDLVVRGDDHLSNTPRQVLIFDALGRTVPRFAHLPMVRGTDGERLSKRHGSVSVADYRESGYPPDGLINALALLGWSPGPDRVLIDRAELVREFDLERVGKSPATFDAAKLQWICAQHLQREPEERLTAAVRERLVAAGYIPPSLPPGTDVWLVGVGGLVRGAVSHHAQIASRCAGLFFRGGEPPDPDAREVLQDGGIEVAGAVAELTATTPPREREGWRATVGEVGRRTGRRGKALYRPLRAAITGEASGPDLDRIVPLMTMGAELLGGEVVATVALRAERTRAWLESR